MTLVWTCSYKLSGMHCEASGWTPLSNESIRDYIKGAVRREWQRWITLDHGSIQSLSQTGFSSDFIEEIVSSGYTVSSRNALFGDFGEVFASLFLASELNMKFPWPPFWDRKNPNSSLGGADLVGLAYDSEGAQVVVGQVKTSNQDNSPPSVVSNREHGLISQLAALRQGRKIVLSLIKWLLLRAESEAWKNDFYRAIARYEKSPTDLSIVGVLIRDCDPAENDLLRAYHTFASEQGARIQLFGCYLPVSLCECVRLANPSSLG